MDFGGECRTHSRDLGVISSKHASLADTCQLLLLLVCCLLHQSGASIDAVACNEESKARQCITECNGLPIGLCQVKHTVADDESSHNSCGVAYHAETVRRSHDKLLEDVTHELCQVFSPLV